MRKDHDVKNVKKMNRLQCHPLLPKLFCRNILSKPQLNLNPTTKPTLPGRTFNIQHLKGEGTQKDSEMILIVVSATTLALVLVAVVTAAGAAIAAMMRERRALQKVTSGDIPLSEPAMVEIALQ